MKLSTENRRNTRSITDSRESVDQLQTELHNLIDEILLAEWDDATACSEMSLHVMNLLVDLDSKISVEVPAVRRLLGVLNKVCMLAENSYRLRVDQFADSLGFVD